MKKYKGHYNRQIKTIFINSKTAGPQEGKILPAFKAIKHPLTVITFWPACYLEALTAFYQKARLKHHIVTDGSQRFSIKMPFLVQSPQFQWFVPWEADALVVYALSDLEIWVDLT